MEAETECGWGIPDCGFRIGEGFGGELGGGPDFGVEELDFVAAEFLDAQAADGAFGLGEDGGGGAVFQRDAAIAGGGAGDAVVGELEDVGVEVFPHLEGLLE